MAFNVTGNANSRCNLLLMGVDGRLLGSQALLSNFLVAITSSVNVPSGYSETDLCVPLCRAWKLFEIGIR